MLLTDIINPLVMILKRQPGLLVGGEAYRASAYVEDLAVVTDLNRAAMSTTALA